MVSALEGETRQTLFNNYWLNLGCEFYPSTEYVKMLSFGENVNTQNVSKLMKNFWDSAMETNKSNYKDAAELILAVHWLTWYHADFLDKNESCSVQMSKLYTDLYYEYSDKYYTVYDGNDEALDYFFNLDD